MGYNNITLKKLLIMTSFLDCVRNAEEYFHLIYVCVRVALDFGCPDLLVPVA